MKSESGLKTPPKWRLKRTLRRRTEFRPIELDDVRYAWAAYKQGKLNGLDFPERLSPEEFNSAFTSLVLSECHAAWTLLAETQKGFIPIGLVFAQWGPGRAHLIILAIVWMPWASKRNMIESMVAFFNSVRKEFPLIGYALPEHKRMYEVCCMHGIGRRIGTSHVIIPGHACAVFETRAA